MHRALLGLAAMSAALAISTPACAQNLAASSGFNTMSGSQRIQVLRGVPNGDFRRFGGSRRDGRHHRRDGRDGDGILASGYYGGGYYDDGDYDANRSFDPDKWNDWWHDRPDRAFPRWVWSNQNCTEDRMWWSGSGWRCTP